MPFWRIYHPETAFTAADHRRALAKSITELYTSRGLPSFEVQVVYIPINLGSFYVGGEVAPLHEVNPPRKHFIRIVIQYVSRELLPQYDETKGDFLNRIDAALRPYIEDKGYDWEYHVEMTDRSLNKLNGMILPEGNTAVEKKWAEDERPSKYEGAFYGKRVMDKAEEKEEKDRMAQEEKEKAKKETARRKADGEEVGAAQARGRLQDQARESMQKEVGVTDQSTLSTRGARTLE